MFIVSQTVGAGMRPQCAPAGGARWGSRQIGLRACQRILTYSLPHDTDYPSSVSSGPGNYAPVKFAASREPRRALHALETAESIAGCRKSPSNTETASLVGSYCSSRRAEGRVMS